VTEKRIRRVWRAVHRIYRFVRANADRHVRHASRPSDDTGLQRWTLTVRTDPKLPPPRIFQSSLGRIARDRIMTMTIMLALRGFLVIMACRIIVATPVPAKVYDQRQTGDLNVQIELKDLRVVALLNSELLDDYTVNKFHHISYYATCAI